MLKFYKILQDDVEWEKKLLIKCRPKSKLKKEKILDPKVKVSARFSLSLCGVIQNININVKYDCFNNRTN